MRGRNQPGVFHKTHWRLSNQLPDFSPLQSPIWRTVFVSWSSRGLFVLFSVPVMIVGVLFTSKVVVYVLMCYMFVSVFVVLIVFRQAYNVR